jgi:hypothetical protein
MIQERCWPVSEGHSFTEEPGPAGGSSTTREYCAKADSIVAIEGIRGEHVHFLPIGLQSDR